MHKASPSKALIKIKIYAPGFISHDHISLDGMMELEQGSTLADLYKKLEIPFVLRPILVCSVNHERANRKTALKDGDIVSFLVPLSGG